MVYLEHEVFPYETDIHRLLKPSQLLRYSMHMSSVQQEDEKLLHTDQAAAYPVGWMLARFRCVQRKPVHMGDKLRICCSPRSIHTAYYIRQAQIFLGEEEAAVVRMVWIPVDMEKRRILRVPELERVLSREAPVAEIEDLRRLPLPKELPPLGELNVPYSLCDRNGHFSSANYVDVVCDACGFWKNGPQLMTEMQVDYHAEYLPEERLVLYGRSEAGAAAARGAHADGKTGFVASFRWTPIED